MIAAFTATTVVSVVALQWTEYAVTGADLLRGFEGKLPAGAMAILIGAFGLTGVGGDEIMQYTYWLIEKGYAAKTGRRDPADPVWAARARGWIRLMYLDAFLSMVVYTVVTAAFYVLGAAVLNARSQVPQGDEMVNTLANMYTESLGPWARWVFVLGAFFVLYSTLFSALAAWTRTFTDAAGQLGVIEFSNLPSRRRSVVFFAWCMPMAWAAIYTVYREPVGMVTLGGIATALILLVVIVGAVDFRCRRSAPELAPGWLYDAGLWLSIASIGSFAAYSGWKTLADLSSQR
jgi:Mn2+/Fe2+ NRAMP family transporter